jgi:hypothetical protein
MTFESEHLLCHKEAILSKDSPKDSYNNNNLMGKIIK